MRLTNIFGKQVYSLYEGEIIGTISGASFNKNLNKISAFKIFDDDENEYNLPLSNIKAFDDCIIITNKNKLELFVKQSETSPMFKEVINETAKHCGLVCDAEVDNNGVVLNFITNSKINLKPENIYLRKNFIYYSTTSVTIQNYKPKTNKVSLLSDINVKILSENKNLDFLPQKIQYNPETILGKQAKNDLLGTNNEIIIKANQQITQKIIDNAKMHNRLNQLFFLAV